MRINPFQQPQDIASTEQANRQHNKKAAQTQTPQQPDGVTLSAQLQQKLAQAPDVRQERVAAIKQAMQDGTYNVSDSQLADAMFKEFFNRG
jgi:negative regulator of flagellin synthesis FlgM